MSPAKPSPNRSRLPYALNVRLSKAQYAYLLIHADSGGSMGDALRQVLDDAIDNTPVVSGPDGHEVQTGTGVRWILEHADLENLDDDARAIVARNDEE